MTYTVYVFFSETLVWRRTFFSENQIRRCFCHICVKNRQNILMADASIVYTVWNGLFVATVAATSCCNACNK